MKTKGLSLQEARIALAKGYVVQDEDEPRNQWIWTDFIKHRLLPEKKWGESVSRGPTLNNVTYSIFKETLTFDQACEISNDGGDIELHYPWGKAVFHYVEEDILYFDLAERRGYPMYAVDAD